LDYALEARVQAFVEQKRERDGHGDVGDDLGHREYDRV
jgi:hypothetical protein